jgi:NAD+ kinase
MPLERIQSWSRKLPEPLNPPMSRDRLTARAPLRRVAVLLHPRVPAAQEMIVDVLAILRRAGVEAVTGSVWGSSDIQAALANADACFVLGGDGSLLRAARETARFGTPLAGINLGRLGFLSEIEPSDIEQRLTLIAGGHFWLESRIMLTANLERNGQADGTFECLNEVVVARRHLSRVVRIDAHIDGHQLATYTADGVMVATPTGSTGYSFAAGGPILHPEVRTLVLTPISPHRSLRSPLVLPETTEVRLVVHTDHEASASFDGQSDVEMHSGDAVTVRVSRQSAQFIRTHDRAYFYRTLVQKLGLGG